MNAILNDEGSRSPSPEPVKPTYVEEQQQLRDETINAFHGTIITNEGSDDDDILVPREKTKDEVEKEEAKRKLEAEMNRDFEGGFGGQEDLEDRYATTSGEH